jgi:antitoxin component of MazEF toxin-antitoxin module
VKRAQMKQHILKIMKGHRVTIPKEVIKEMGLEKIEWIALSIDGNRILLQPCEICEIIAKPYA